MNQREFLQAFDADLVAAFADVGTADAATHVAVDGGAVTPCTVLVDRAAQFFGVTGEVAGRRITVTLFLAAVPAPAVGDTVALAGTGEVFELSELDDSDESKSRWVVTRG